MFENTVIWGFIGTIIGAFVSIITTNLNNKNNSKLQNESNKIKEEQLFRNFQKDNLHEIQELLNEFVRFNINASLIYLNCIKKGEKLILDDELDNNLRISIGRFNVLTERIFDNEVREETKKFKNIFSDLIILDTEESIIAYQKKVLDGFSAYTNYIGPYLRSLYTQS